MASQEDRAARLMAANAEFAKTWKAPFTMKQLRANADEAILCLTCMDPRVVPEQFLGPAPRIAVFRNAGGRYSPDVVRTITVLRSLMNKAEKPTVMVVHHTDCGMTHLTNDEIKGDVKKRGKGVAQAEDIDFGCFAADDLEKVILEDVEALKAEEILEGVDVRGFVLTTETGVLREI